MQPMDTKIVSVIKKFSYPMWFILAKKDVDCSCVDFHTKQPVPGCPKCLGTGHQVKIVRSNAAHQNDTAMMSGNGLGSREVNVVPVFYTLTDIKCEEGDIVVDGNEAFVVQHYFSEHSNESKPVYYKIVGAPLKNNVDKFMDIFHETLRGAGYE